jgi:protein TonB
MGSLQKPITFWLAVSLALHALLWLGFTQLPPPATEPIHPQTTADLPMTVRMQTRIISQALPEIAAQPAPNLPEPLLTGTATRTLETPPAESVDPLPEPAPRDPEKMRSPPEMVEAIKVAELPDAIPMQRPESPTDPVMEPAPTSPLVKSERAPPPAVKEVKEPEVEAETESAKLEQAALGDTTPTSRLGQRQGSAAALIRGDLPPYPRAARNLGISGVVTVLKVAISAEGKPTDVSLIESCGRADMDRSALNTVRRKWRFEPARDAQNQPIGSTEQIVIEWTLR